MIDNAKEIKNLILDSSSNLDEIMIFLQSEFRSTIKEIFNSLLILLKNYDKNKKRVNEILDFLERFVEEVPIDKLNYFIAPIHDFDNKINYKFKLKQRKAIQSSCFRVHEILNNVQHKKMLYTYNGKMNYLEFLIFQDKNLSMIEVFLQNDDKVLNGSEEENIFDIILKKYLFLDERNQEEIKFLYQVMSLFIHSQHGEFILSNQKHYLNIIKQSRLGYKEHIIQAIELLDPNFKISLEEIEKRYGVNFQFPNIILKEAEQFQLSSQRRFDFTYQECITIDSENALVLDDAIYIEKNKNGTFTLYIHITDVASLIPYSSLVNEEARKRMETLYVKDYNILMYPENISNNRCSLLPNCNRNVITYMFQLDSHFELIENYFRVVKGKICSKHKLSYETVDELVLHPKNDPLNQMIIQLFHFATKRRKQNQQKEIYRQYENFLYFETHHESLKLDYSPAANIVHESMVLVNYQIAKHFKKLSYPYIFRKVEWPSDDFIEKQLLKIQKMDPKIKKDKEFLHHLRESYIESSYSGIPIFHKGLNLECYSHSTSPARRYADAFGQYVMYELLFHKKVNDEQIQCWEYRVNELANYLNEKKKANEIFTSQYNYLSYKRLIKKK